MNKTDQFIDFDPTQHVGEGCCGNGVTWDFENQTWSKTTPRTDDCAAQLATANAALAEAKQALVDKDKALADKDQTIADRDSTIADLEKTVEDKTRQVTELGQTVAEQEATINELREQIANQPTVCEILAQHLDPIRRLNGEVIWYGLKNADGCPDLDTSKEQSLGNQDLTTVVGPIVP